MNYNTKSMFDSIKKALQESGKKGNTNFKDFLKLDAGNTYLVRLLPNVNSPEDTFFHYYHYGWNSVSTGQYVEVLSPKTWGDPDPIEAERIKLYMNKSDKYSISLARNIFTKEKWLVNVYVIDDPVHPENNGTVKVLRYGKQLAKIINSAIDGEDADEFGPAIFDLSENGCNLKIRVDSTREANSQTVFVNYTSSRFARASAIPNMTPEKSKEILDNLHDLPSYFPRKSPAELKEILATHLYGRDVDESIQVSSDDLKSDNNDDNNEYEVPSVLSVSSSDSLDQPLGSTDIAADDDDKIRSLLADLDNITTKE